MQEDYDVQLFEKLYNNTENLREYLTRQIDARRFGVTPDIIKSWFDDKFIFVFNQYYNKMDENTLKGYIINSLKTFKFRVLRNAYTKSNLYNDQVSIEDNNKLVNIIPLEDDWNDHEELYNLALTFMKAKLSPDAYLILNLDLNPPPYIASKVKSIKTKIPAKLIAEYLGLEPDQSSIHYINSLRKEVVKVIDLAKEFFNNPLNHNKESLLESCLLS